VVFAYTKGATHAENAAKASYADALSDAIANARETARIDTEAAVKQSEARQKVRTEFKERVVTVERLINANPSPRECRIPDAAVSLFRDAINAANNTAPAAKPEPMPAPAKPTGRPTGHISADVSGYD
tara:strand:- start:155 stop:538 length:384 start_codon:yes stop_codon:yes gene_type:complete